MTQAKPRRTFAIISHPDAGKTTLTEKLLLKGGAIHLAGEVKARGDNRRARSDWMKIEQQRGISVTSSVMTFERGGIVFNLLDTPGHEDFSEDTYRTLTAVDSAIMVIDAASGIEAQTLKLFEVCRMRNVPIITFVNKVDREGRDPFELLDEVADKLALDVCPMSWPTGMGGQFEGVYDLVHNQLHQPTGSSKQYDGVSQQFTGLDDPKLAEVLSEGALERLTSEGELAQGGYSAFDLEAYQNGDLTPVYFGSALKQFGVEELIEAIANHAPSPRPQPAEPAPIDPESDDVTGFIFKIQANMDPQHRDRIAFMRLCSGEFKRGMKLTQPRHITGGRYAERKEPGADHRPAQFCAGNPPPRNPARSDQDQAAPQGAGRSVGRGRGPGLLSRTGRQLDHRRGRAAAARGIGVAAGGRV